MVDEQPVEQPGAPVAAALAALAVLLAVGSVSVLTGATEVRWGADDASASTATPTPRATRTRTPTPTPTPTPAGPVLEAAGSEPVPTRAGLAAALDQALGASTLGPHVGLAIREVGGEGRLYGRDPIGSYVPASTTKILTCTAVLAALGPRHRFETAVVRGKQPGVIVLRGGGDPLLTTAATKARATKQGDDFSGRATIDGLAARTAERLRSAGTKSVRLRVDDRLFTGSASPRWESQYIPSGVVAPVSALWVDEAKTGWPSRWPRADDPALDAARTFDAALQKYGVQVRGEPSRGWAPADGEQIASVSSPPLVEIVEQMLLVSDNDIAEVLARQVAVAEGRPATFGGASSAIRSVLGRLGVKTGSVRLYDGSGLSRDNRITPDVLTQTLLVAADPRHTSLRGVLTGLPVAGFSGSLDERFWGSAESGAGLVRAKTGTLSGVASLAGLAMTRDGVVLAFALMSDRVPAVDPRPALDRVAAALASCGCR